MKTSFKNALAILALIISFSSAVDAKVNVFACSPEWASLTEEIGKDLITVKSATKANQDIHYMQAKPSLLLEVNKADLIFCTGAALESSWLPTLVSKAGNPNVQQETRGWLMASDYVDKIYVQGEAHHGHVHPEGNPHVHTNPHNIKIIAEVLAARLSLLDPDNRNHYKKNFDDFNQKWSNSITKWEQQAAPLKGKKVIVYHKSWDYMIQWLGMETAASLESHPGHSPSAGYLNKMLNAVEGQDIFAILIAPHETLDAAEWLSNKTRYPVLPLPYTIGGSDKATNLESLFEETIHLLNTQVKQNVQ